MDYLMIMNMYMSNRQNYCSTNFVLLCLGLSGDRLPHGGNQATGQPNNRAHGHMDGHMDGHRSTPPAHGHTGIGNKAKS